MGSGEQKPKPSGPIHCLDACKPSKIVYLNARLLSLSFSKSVSGNHFMLFGFHLDGIGEDCNPPGQRKKAILRGSLYNNQSLPLGNSSKSATKIRT